jgi:hypothetical protein
VNVVARNFYQATASAYYGVSWLDENDKVKYHGTANEAFPGQGRQYSYELLRIEKAEYPAEVVQDPLSKKECIKDVFDGLTANRKPDINHPCIEWYSSDRQVICLVKPW